MHLVHRISLRLKGAERKRAISELKQQSPYLFRLYESDLHLTEATNAFMKGSRRYPLTAFGKLNLYALFAELAMLLINKDGRVGIVVQTGIATDDGNKAFFDALSRTGRLVSLFSFENEEFLFRNVHHSIRFCLLTMRGESATSSPAEFVFFARQPSVLGDRHRRFTLSSDDILRINPNTRTAPIFRSNADADFTKKIYSKIPVLIKEAEGDKGDPWGAIVIQNFFSTSNYRDQQLFKYDKDIEEVHSSLMPVRKGTMIEHFDHRAATYDRISGKFLDTDGHFRSNVSLPIRSDKYISRDEVLARLSSKGWNRCWLIGWRDITSAHVLRTLIASFLPIGPTDDTLSLLLPSKVDTKLAAVFLGSLNSLIFDYIARQKVGWTHVRKYIIAQLPVLPPGYYSQRDIDFM